MNKRKEPLYRKENKVSLSCKYYVVKGGDFRHTRNTKEFNNSEVSHLSMNSGKYGYDYTPLFKFLLSKVGESWDLVYSEAKSRLDREEPIFWIVALNEIDKEDVVRTGESTYYSGLFVSEGGILQLVNPNAKVTVEKACFETISFNGKPIG